MFSKPGFLSSIYRSVLEWPLGRKRKTKTPICSFVWDQWERYFHLTNCILVNVFRGLMEHYINTKVGILELPIFSPLRLTTSVFTHLYSLLITTSDLAWSSFLFLHLHTLPFSSFCFHFFLVNSFESEFRKLQFLLLMHKTRKRTTTELGPILAWQKWTNQTADLQLLFNQRAEITRILTNSFKKDVYLQNTWYNW